MGPDDTGVAPSGAAAPLCPTCGGAMSGPISQASIAKSAGFPMAGAAPAPSATTAAPVSARMTPTLNPGTGTTELIPGATDIVRSLFSDLLPSASASQAPAGSKAVINATKYPAQPNGFPDSSKYPAVTGMRG